MSGDELLADIGRTRVAASLLFTRAAVEQALDCMASDISTRLGHTNPLLLGVMTGGMVPLSLLLGRLEFPLQVDYVHATRYGHETSGGELRWIRRPPAAVAGRTVLVIDDLLDRGITLAQIARECTDMGAARVLTAVLLTKTVPERPGLDKTDFSGLTGPDRYVFGYGMDYKTYWRNGAGIFAVTE